MIVTVTLNAAIDRTLTVPNFQRGQRHRASAGAPLAGGKGINVARALKTLGVPVVATGLVGGQTGTRIVERADRGGDPQRLRADRRRVAHVDRGRRPDRRHLHRDQRVGARRARRTSSRRCSRSSRYLTQGAELVVFAGSLPRDVDDDFYAEAIHDLARRHVPAVIDCEGEPLRLGVEAEPFLVSPNQREAEALVGQEFHDDEDFALGARRDRRPGRAQRDHHHRAGLRRAAARRARGAAASARSRRGSSRCRRSAGRRAARRVHRRAPRGPPAEEACAPPSPRAPPRRSSSAPAASTRGRPDGCRRASS